MMVKKNGTFPALLLCALFHLVGEINHQPATHVCIMVSRNSNTQQARHSDVKQAGIKGNPKNSTQLTSSSGLRLCDGQRQRRYARRNVQTISIHHAFWRFMIFLSGISVFYISKQSYKESYFKSPKFVDSLIFPFRLNDCFVIILTGVMHRQGI